MDETDGHDGCLIWDAMTGRFQHVPALCRAETSDLTPVPPGPPAPDGLDDRDEMESDTTAVDRSPPDARGDANPGFGAF